MRHAPLGLEHIAMAASLSSRAQIKRRAGWDYVTFNAHYVHGVDVPPTFKGFSGGGIWAVLLRLKADGKIEIENYCLVGISFFQSSRQKDVRRVLGHFTRSIFARAWMNHGAQFRVKEFRAP